MRKGGSSDGMREKGGLVAAWRKRTRERWRVVRNAPSKPLTAVRRMSRPSPTSRRVDGACPARLHRREDRPTTATRRSSHGILCIRPERIVVLRTTSILADSHSRPVYACYTCGGGEMVCAALSTDGVTQFCCNIPGQDSIRRTRPC